MPVMREDFNYLHHRSVENANLQLKKAEDISFSRDGIAVCPSYTILISQILPLPHYWSYHHDP